MKTNTNKKLFQFESIFIYRQNSMGVIFPLALFNELKSIKNHLMTKLKSQVTSLSWAYRSNTCQNK